MGFELPGFAFLHVRIWSGWAAAAQNKVWVSLFPSPPPALPSGCSFQGYPVLGCNAGSVISMSDSVGCCIAGSPVAQQTALLWAEAVCSMCSSDILVRPKAAWGQPLSMGPLVRQQGARGLAMALVCGKKHQNQTEKVGYSWVIEGQVNARLQRMAAIHACLSAKWQLPVTRASFRIWSWDSQKVVISFHGIYCHSGCRVTVNLFDC